MQEIMLELSHPPTPMPTDAWLRLMLSLERVSPGRGAIGVLRAHMAIRARHGTPLVLCADDALACERAVRDGGLERAA